MPPFVPLVPPSKRNGADFNASAVEPAFSAPVRWALRVLAWLAFGIASYLAWHSVNQTSVAGCGVGSNSGCDLVLTSSWSKWLGVPVAVLGLACYASLAALSVLLGIRSAPANRWITTAFVLLSIVAAGASLWFIGIQIFAIGSFCPYCLVADSCGIAMGGIATVLAMRAAFARRGIAQSRTMQPGLMALRTALPPASRGPQLMLRPQSSPPSLVFAMGGAIPLVALLIGGQLLFAAKTFEVEKVALKNSINMVGSKAAANDDASTTASTHTAMRVPNDSDVGEKSVAPDNAANAHVPSNASGKSAAAGDKKSPDASPPAAAPTEPSRQRLVKLLNGKLTLDVYQHPIIGSPQAPHIAVEMVSYDCPHCRKMYPIMQHALERYGDQVALLIMVIPMEKECNKLITDPAASHQGACATARLALGVAKFNPSAFATFHDFLMSGKDKPPAMGSIIPKAYVLADRARLREFTGGPEAKKQIVAYVDLFAQLEKQNQSKKEFGLPIQILGDYIMSGSAESEADVFKAWEQHLGVKPR